MNDKSEAPLWAWFIALVGIFAPIAIMVFVMFTYGLWPAAWTALAVLIANTGNRAERIYFRK